MDSAYEVFQCHRMVEYSRGKPEKKMVGEVEQRLYGGIIRINKNI